MKRYLLKDFLNHIDLTHFVRIYKTDLRKLHSVTLIYRGSPFEYLNDKNSKDYFIESICASFGEIVIYV